MEGNINDFIKLWETFVSKNVNNMQAAYVNLNGVPTHVITYGRWIEESLSGIKELTICITGNPGLPGFYTEFAEILQQKLGSETPVWVIGHAGHDDPPETSLREVPQLKGNEDIYNLDGQIAHKIEFIKKYVPKHVKIHLIGHSIGAWMILQLLQVQQIRERIQKCYMLFPTIEKMLESPNGWIFTKIAMPFYSVFGFMLILFNMLPVMLRLLLIQLYFWVFSIPNRYKETALKYSKVSVTEKIVFLADDEMAQVRELQTDIVRENLSLLKFYYGTTDGWVPVEYYEALMKQFPNADAELDTKKIDHAFVLRHSKLMADIVAEMILKNSCN